DGVTEEDLPRIRSLLADLPVGEEVALSILRAGSPVTLALTPRDKGKVEGEDFDCKKWNMTVKAINEFATPELYYYVKKGVYIQGVRSPGNASQAGLRRGDTIVRIEDKPVESLAELSEIYNEIVANESATKRVRMEILRSGLPRQVVLDYSTKYERE
ncbi:MAG: PDZ domain-containing protein, partial [Planctomycetota bacterium]